LTSTNCPASLPAHESQQCIQNGMTGCNTTTTRIVQETVASLFQHVLAPSNPPPSFSFGVHPTPNSFVIEDLSPSLFNLAEPATGIPLQKIVANTGAAATLAASSIPHVPSSTASSPTPALLPQTPLPTRSITLAGGIHIVFTEDDVPRPPSVSFARDIKRDLPVLNGMWDDCTEHWGGFSFLNIHGHPIPIVYWKAVYSSKQGNGWKPGEWKLIKSNYFDWKVSIFFPVCSVLFPQAFAYIDLGHTLAQRNA
jgi:hypothetical protein